MSLFFAVELLFHTSPFIRMQNVFCPIPNSQKDTRKAFQRWGKKRSNSNYNASGKTRQPHTTACLELFEQERPLHQRCSQIKHSYANIIISLSSMCVGGGDEVIENLDISISTTSFPPFEEVEVRFLLKRFHTNRRGAFPPLLIYLSISSPSPVCLSLCAACLAKN